MSLQTLKNRVALNGLIIAAAISAGIGLKPVPPPPVTGGATDADLDALEADLALQGAALQAAIDAGAAAPAPGPVLVPSPAAAPVPRLDSVTVSPAGIIAAGDTASVLLIGSNLAGGSVVGTGGLAFANAKDEGGDGSAIQVDVTAVAGTAPGDQLIGVMVDGVTSNELPISVT